MTDKGLLYMINRMDAKLRDYMTAEEHATFSKEIAKEAFRIDIEDMEDNGFKAFVIEHFDEITR